MAQQVRMPDAGPHSVAAPAPRQLLPRLTGPSRQGLMVCSASLVPATVFGLAAWMRLQTVLRLLGEPSWSQDLGGRAHWWLSLGHEALTMAFMALVAMLFLVRRPSIRNTSGRSRFGDLAAIAGSLTIMLPILAPRPNDGILSLALSELLLTVGMGITVVALLSLGRCFGVLPRARGLVRNGLYRHLRHPMYLGEFIAFAGVLVPVLSPATAAAFVLCVALQLYRAAVEERTLSAVFPEYHQYKLSTRRLIPGIY